MSLALHPFRPLVLHSPTDRTTFKFIPLSPPISHLSLPRLDNFVLKESDLAAIDHVSAAPQLTDMEIRLARQLDDGESLRSRAAGGRERQIVPEQVRCDRQVG